MLQELDGWLSDAVISQLELAARGHNYPKLRALRDLKEKSPQKLPDETLSEYIILNSREEKHVKKALKILLQLTDHMINHLKRVASIEEEKDSDLMQHIRDVQGFCDYSKNLLEQISQGLTCSKEHQLYAHLSGYGSEDWAFECLLEPCDQYPRRPGSYPVTFSRLSTSNASIDQAGTLRPVNICQHVCEARKTLKKAQIHCNQGVISVAKTVSLERHNEADLIKSFDDFSTLLAEDNSSGLDRSNIRRFQCLLAQSLLYLWSSPWMTHFGDLKRMSVPATVPAERFAKIYLHQCVTSFSNGSSDASQEGSGEIDDVLFMARFGLLLLQLEHHKILRLPEAENEMPDDVVTTLNTYLGELPKPPEPLVPIFDICSDFTSYVDHFYGQSAYNYDERCRLTILTKIIQPLIADLADTYTNAYNKSNSLRKSRDLFNEEVQSTSNSRKHSAIDNAKAELRKKREILADGDLDQHWWIPPLALQEAWKVIGVQAFLESQGVKLHEKFHRDMEETYLSLLITLLFIDWDRWPYINALLFHDQERLLQDRNLPVLHPYRLVFSNYLNSDQVERFLDTQHHYTHLVLPAPSIGNVEEISEKCLLPFLNQNPESPTARNIRARRTRVFKHEIPARCLRNRDGDLNSRSIRIVRKVINDKTRDNEENVARILSDCNVKHAAILEILTMYRKAGNLEIIYPLAETDLDTFITGTSYDNYWLMKEALAILLVEMRSLAGGLKYLHSGLEDRIRRDLSVCHMDFKPDNILVFLGPEETSYGNQRNFRFKISDFGIAKIRPKPGYKALLEQPDILKAIPADVTETKTSVVTRDAGTYSAPEMKYDTNNVGLKSDVWSFACIFLKLLIRLVLGNKGLSEFDTERSEANNKEDFFFSDDSSYGCTGLNSAVAAWLDRLSDPNDLLGIGMEMKLRDRSHIRIPLKPPNHIRAKLPDAFRAALEVRDTERCSAEQLYATLTAMLARET